MSNTQSMQTVVNNWPISLEEYEELEKQFIKLCHKQAWILLGMNWKNNCSDEQEDIVQDLRIAMIKAASYYKRQTYIEKSFNALKTNVDDPFILRIVNELEDLWDNRTRHGANRQKFGEHQETILERLVKKCVPKSQRPDRNAPIVIDSKFKTYCKQITWNELKQKGKKITREKFWRTGMVSISEFDFLGGNGN